MKVFAEGGHKIFLERAGITSTAGIPRKIAMRH
jgi:hypothetical protein